MADTSQVDFSRPTKAPPGRTSLQSRLATHKTSSILKKRQDGSPSWPARQRYCPTAGGYFHAPYLSQRRYEESKVRTNPPKDRPDRPSTTPTGTTDHGRFHAPATIPLHDHTAAKRTASTSARRYTSPHLSSDQAPFPPKIAEVARRTDCYSKTVRKMRRVKRIKSQRPSRMV